MEFAAALRGGLALGTLDDAALDLGLVAFVLGALGLDLDLVGLEGLADRVVVLAFGLLVALEQGLGGGLLVVVESQGLGIALEGNGC